VLNVLTFSNLLWLCALYTTFPFRRTSKIASAFTVCGLY
jgi:hypothetical protein